MLSVYKAQEKNSYSTGEGTKQAKVKATYKLLYKGSAAPGTNETYLQVIYNKISPSKGISGKYCANCIEIVFVFLSPATWITEQLMYNSKTINTFYVLNTF